MIDSIINSISFSTLRVPMNVDYKFFEYRQRKNSNLKMLSTENPINVTEVPVIETDEDWGFTKAETVGINLGLVPRQSFLAEF